MSNNKSTKKMNTRKKEFMKKCAKVSKDAIETLTKMINKYEEYSKYERNEQIQRIENQVYNLKYYNNI